MARRAWVGGVYVYMYGSRGAQWLVASNALAGPRGRGVQCKNVLSLVHVGVLDTTRYFPRADNKPTRLARYPRARPAARPHPPPLWHKIGVTHDRSQHDWCGRLPKFFFRGRVLREYIQPRAVQSAVESWVAHAKETLNVLEVPTGCGKSL